jgi:hypothetical protein
MAIPFLLFEKRQDFHICCFLQAMSSLRLKIDPDTNLCLIEDLCAFRADFEAVIDGFFTSFMAFFPSFASLVKWRSSRLRFFQSGIKLARFLPVYIFRFLTYGHEWIECSR